MRRRVTVSLALAGASTVGAAAIAAAVVHPSTQAAISSTAIRTSAPAAEPAAARPQATPPAEAATGVAPEAAPALAAAEPVPPPVLPRRTWGGLASASDAAKAMTITQTYLLAADTSYTRGSLEPVVDEKLAIGSALGEMRATLDELTAAGLVQRGRVTVEKASVFSVKQPNRLLAVTCLDSSAVELVQVGDNGDSAVVRPATKPGTRRDLHEFLLQQVGSRWVVLKHDMPADTSCDR